MNFWTIFGWVAAYASLIFLFVYFVFFLVDTWRYKNELKMIYDGKPKAHYPEIKKPSFFNSNKNSKHGKKRK